MTVLYRNLCYSEGSYNEVDLYLLVSLFAFLMFYNKTIADY